MKEKSGTGSTKLWKKVTRDKNLARQTLLLSERDLIVAGELLNEDSFDWSFIASYNAMLQAGRAMMFYEGLRARGEFKHIAVVEYLKRKSELGTFPLIIDKMRGKRHKAVYDSYDIVDEDSAEKALENAEAFVGMVREIVEKSRP